MELSQLIQRAQQALDSGEHHIVEAACHHALAIYPTCLSAHRLLGESSLEQGRLEEAIERFGVVLAIDPLDVVSNLGLGIAAEEQGDLTTAHTRYLQAWERNPSLDQLRDELLRLQQAVQGQPRLHRSRAGLANLYARTGQFTRAAAEWRAILATEPENSRHQLALLEVLWRQGDEAMALPLCRALLARAPETARALVIQADLEQRRGLPDAAATASRYRALDPTGELLTQLQQLKPQAALAWILPEPAIVPAIDLDAIQPAPPAAATVEPAVAASAPASEPDTTGGAPDLWDSLVRDMGAGGDGNDLDLEGLVPFDWAAEGGEAADPFVAAVLTEPVPPPVAAPPAPASLPVAPSGAARTPAAPAPEPFLTADGQVDLTIGWDELDRTLAAATPKEDDGTFADLIAEFGADGIAPFNPLESDPSDSSWAPFTEDDFADLAGGANGQGIEETADDALLFAEPAVEPAAAADELAWPDDLVAAPAQEDVSDLVAALASMTEEGERESAPASGSGWGALEEEFAAAIPPPLWSGDDAIETLDDEDLAPLEFESLLEDVDPLANPDAVGDPLAFDDLLMVTSQDATAPLGGGMGALPDDLAGLEPFSFEDLAPAHDGAVDFSDVPDLPPFVSETIEPALPGDDTPFATMDDADEFARALAAMGMGEPGGDDDLSEEALADDLSDEALAAGAFDVDALTVEALATADALSVETFAAEAFAAALAADELAEEPLEWPPDDDALVAAAEPEVVTRAPEPMAVEAAVAAAATAPPEAADAPIEPAQPSDSSSPWPAFVTGTSILVDRFGEVGVIFPRLREEKASLIGLGMIRSERRLAPRSPEAPSGRNGTAPLATPGTAPLVAPGTAPLVAAEVASGERVAEPVLATVPPPPRVRRAAVDTDLVAAIAAWRERLRAGTDEAEAVVNEVEQRIAESGPEPVYLRLLGDAYLAMGRPDLASSQFRAATLRRARR